MNIVLKIKQDGSTKRTEKKFQASFLPAILFKRTLQLNKEFENMGSDDMDEEATDTMVQYIVDVFDNQFTMEEFYQGCDIENILPKFKECIETVMNKFANKSKELADLNQ